MLCRGTIVQGIWHKQSYRIHKELGRGAIGAVYLVENLRTSQFCAMKVSQSMQSIASEHKRLQTIQREVQSQHFGPLLFEMDDIDIRGQKHHFYTMEYIDGRVFDIQSIQGGIQVALLYISQILRHLDSLHAKGYVFADVKAENILIDNRAKRIRFVDFGGVVKSGRMVKQFSVMYDRGSWRMGSRKAEAQYDLFAVGVLFLQLFIPKATLLEAQKSANSMYMLYDIIHRKLQPQYKSICFKVFSEKYQSAAAMDRDVQDLIKGKGQKAKSKGFLRRLFKQWTLIDSALWASFVCMVGVVVFVVQTMLK